MKGGRNGLVAGQRKNACTWGGKIPTVREIILGSRTEALIEQGGGATQKEKLAGWEERTIEISRGA